MRMLQKLQMMNYIICSLPKKQNKNKIVFDEWKKCFQVMWWSVYCGRWSAEGSVEVGDCRSYCEHWTRIPSSHTHLAVEQLPPAALGLGWLTKRRKKKDIRIMRKIMRRGREERSPIPNYLVCSGRGQLQDWISLVRFKMGSFLM